MPLKVAPLLAVSPITLPLDVALAAPNGEFVAGNVPDGEALSCKGGEGVTAPLNVATNGCDGETAVLQLPSVEAVPTPANPPSEGLLLLVTPPLPVPGCCEEEGLNESTAVKVSPPPLLLRAADNEGRGVADSGAVPVARADSEATPSGLPLASSERESALGVNVPSPGERDAAPCVGVCAALCVSSPLPLPVLDCETAALPVEAPLGVPVCNGLREEVALLEGHALALPVKGTLVSAEAVKGAVAEDVNGCEADAAAVPVGGAVAGADALPVAAAEALGVAPPLSVPAPLPLCAALPCAVADGVAQALLVPDCRGETER